MRNPVAVTTDTMMTSFGWVLRISRTIGLAATISPTDAACTQMAWRFDIFSFKSSGRNPMLCLMR